MISPSLPINLFPLQTDAEPTFNLKLIDVNNINVSMVRQINSILFPIVYSESFYQSIATKDPTRVAKLGNAY